MDEVVQPTLAFVGHQVEVAFLKSLLEGSGIACWVDHPVWGESGVRDARLFVAHTDMKAAAELVADFRQHGTHSKI